MCMSRRFSSTRRAPGVLPFVVQIHDQVQAPVRMRDRMAVEVDVRIQVLAFAVLVRAAAEIVRVVQQIGDAGDLRHQRKKCRGLDEVVERGIARPECADLLDHGLVADLAHFVQRTLGIEVREFRKQSIGCAAIEEVVDDDMPERVAALEGGGEFGNTGLGG